MVKWLLIHAGIKVNPYKQKGVLEGYGCYQTTIKYITAQAVCKKGTVK